jgi:hypothetical protein
MPERRILIHALVQQDAVLAGKVLAAAGIASSVCTDTADMMRQLAQGAGALLTVEELIAETAPALRRYLERQPGPIFPCWCSPSMERIRWRRSARSSRWATSR